MFATRVLMRAAAVATLIGALALGFTPGTTAQEDQLSLFPIAVTLTPTDDGWQKIEIVVGIRNDTPSALLIEFPNYENGTVSILEGHSYDVELEWGVRPAHDPFLYDGGLFDGFELPQSSAFCGFMTSSSAAPMLLRASGYIPQDTALASLDVLGFAPADLTQGASADLCRTEPPVGESELPSTVTIGSDGDSLYLEMTLTPMSAQATDPGTPAQLQVDITNLNKFDDANLSMSTWAAYGNGIWVSPTSDDDASAPCTDAPIDTRLGPSQSMTSVMCLPGGTESMRPLLVVASDPRYGFHFVATDPLGVGNEPNLGLPEVTQTVQLNEVRGSGVTGKAQVIEEGGLIKIKIKVDGINTVPEEGESCYSSTGACEWIFAYLLSGSCDSYKGSNIVDHSELDENYEISFTLSPDSFYQGGVRSVVIEWSDGAGGHTDTSYVIACGDADTSA